MFHDHRKIQYCQDISSSSLAQKQYESQQVFLCVCEYWQIGSKVNMGGKKQQQSSQHNIEGEKQRSKATWL